MARRQVIQDQTFDEQAALLERNTKRLDEIIDGAIWMIANHAEDCAIIEGNLRVVFTDPFPDAPAMRIFLPSQMPTIALCIGLNILRLKTNSLACDRELQ